MAIFQSMCQKNGYALTAEAEEYAAAFFADLYENRDDNFGNARDVRNIFENMVVRQADRLSVMDAPDKDALMEVRKEDFIETQEESNG